MAQLLFPLLLVALLVPMFLGVRRQKREAANTTSMQENLKVGDRVTTTSGLYGTVVDLDETTIDLEIAEDVVTTWLRAAVREVRTEDAAESAELESHDSELEPDAPAAEPQPPHSAVNGATAEAVNGAPAEESVEDTNARLTKE
ncbi:preprotein translocase subunit YajC [Nocardia vaccinii]|uniref:preprotein translocase subunit YajC n=1 Tax=Nocardia vaccinii TaxID=1822 RepID=UPI00082A65D1|nr:preprotein translocase subunit YajC [Nocardia vaccinii]